SLYPLFASWINPCQQRQTMPANQNPCDWSYRLIYPSKMARKIVSAVSISTTNILRRLRLIKSANDLSASGRRKKDAHQKLADLENWSAKATLLIFFGIVFDIAIVLYFPHEWPERIASILANGLIGLGLIIEYFVILRVIVASGEAQRESDERVA